MADNVIEVPSYVWDLHNTVPGTPVRRVKRKYVRYILAERRVCEKCGGEFWAWPNHGEWTIDAWTGQIRKRFNWCARCLWDNNIRRTQTTRRWDGMFAEE